MSPGGLATCPTHLWQEAEGATGQGRGRVPFSNSFLPGMGRDQVPHQLSVQPRCLL